MLGLADALPLFVPLADTASTLEVFADDAAGAEGEAPLDDVFWVVGLCRNRGAGKFDFLSIASTVRW